MHALANRALERFVCDIYGRQRWLEVTSVAALGFDTFEPLLTYDPTITESVINAACFELGKVRAELLEDLGHHIVTHPSSEPMRRLLRFGGAGFKAFLDSLEDLPERARLALPDKDFPPIEMLETERGEYTLTVSTNLKGIGHIILGAIRGMADDYGALVTIEHRCLASGAESLRISVHDSGFSPGRTFDLATPVSS